MSKTVRAALVAVPIAAIIVARYLVTGSERCRACGHDWYVHFSGSGGGCWTGSANDGDPCFCTCSPAPRGSFPGSLTPRRIRPARGGPKLSPGQYAPDVSARTAV